VIALSSINCLFVTARELAVATRTIVVPPAYKTIYTKIKQTAKQTIKQLNKQ
jgi:hypothetical protein